MWQKNGPTIPRVLRSSLTLAITKSIYIYIIYLGLILTGGRKKAALLTSGHYFPILLKEFKKAHP